MKKVFSISVILFGIIFSGFSQTYFDLQKDGNYKCGWDNSMPETSGLLTLEKYDPIYLQQIFDSISNFNHVEYNYPQGGCQHRAHIMSLFLKKYKIAHAKIWLFAPVDLDFDKKETLFITDKNELSDKNIVNWNYHVAPILLSKNKSNNKIDTLVFDPSIDRNHPLNIRIWLSKIGNSNLSKYTMLKPEQYFFYAKYMPDGVKFSTVISGCLYKYEGYTKDNFTIEKGLALNDMCIIMFNKYIKPIQNNPTQIDKLNSLKLIFGNATTSDLIFGTGGSITNQNILTALDKNKDIVEEAKKVFADKLLYWKTEIQKLQ